MAKTPEREVVTKENASPSPTIPPTTPLTSPETTTDLPKLEKRPKLWVELRHLTAEEKETYEKVPSKPDRIVGEVMEHGERFVFALFDTIAYRVKRAHLSI
jgi:hypothetical protein